MASRKKTSKKVGRKTIKSQLPKGYEAIGGFGKSWPNDDTEEGDMLVGSITDFDEFTTGTGKDKRDVETLKLETKDGVFTLYNSAGLKALFEYEEGTEVAVIFNGYGEAKKGRNAPKLFEVGVK